MLRFDAVPVYYINLDKDAARRARLEAQFAKYAVTATRVSGVDATPEFVASCELPPGHGLKPAELACSAAHLQALRRYLESSDAPMALVVEDDVDFSVCEHWNFSFAEFLARVPDDWDCIQLANSQVSQAPQWHRRQFSDWGTVAYVIRRAFAEELVRAHLRDGRFAPYARDNTRPARAENVLYHTPRAFVASLFTYHVYFSSNIHQEHVALCHVPARRRVLWWWKSRPAGDSLRHVFAAPETVAIHPAPHIDTLEYHVTHSCNLSCQQCSHYSNFRLGGMATVEQARQEYALWADRIRPQLFALLGGEPALNPELTAHVRLAREAWPDSELMLVSNAFFLDRHPDLPGALVDVNCCLDISKHGNTPEYARQFEQNFAVVKDWQARYPRLIVNLRQSHKGWMRQYRVIDGKPLPYESEPAAAYGVCMQKTCTQLYRGLLWKCPALAYYGMFEKKLRLEEFPEWQLFRDYQACSPDADDETVRRFFAEREIPQCRLCPSRREGFAHPDPLLRDEPLL